MQMNAKSILYLHHVLITELLIIIIHGQSHVLIYTSIINPSYPQIILNNRYHIILSVYILICIIK